MSKVYFQVDWGSFCNPLKEAMLQARFAEDEQALEKSLSGEWSGFGPCVSED